MAVLATPQMIAILSESLFVQLDVTFPQMHTFPYLLNMVAYNYTTLEFQVVARVLMSKLTAKAYKSAFEAIFSTTTNLHPGFDNGFLVKAWIVDFSEAQSNGLAQNLGEKAEVIRGCSVHFMCNAEKTAVKIGEDEFSREVFKKIAFKIPTLEHQKDVKLAFKVLCGETPLDSVNHIFKFSQTELSVKTDNWYKAKKWSEWWQKDRIIKMFSKSFKEMCDADWALCPTTTNAVESHNKISHTKTTLLVANLETYYRIDKRAAYNTLAASIGIKIGDPDDIKKRKKENRETLRRRRKREICLVADDDNDATEIQSCNKRPRGTTDTVDECTDVDNYIGKTVWIDTFGARNKKYNWCKATVESVDKGVYIARYVDAPKFTAKIPDILNDKEVRFNDFCLPNQK